ncbi:hypothetical protein MK079_01005 [Candidatus Gracilibacteria bacterium]|nr:hypothetical protein [Candidatus Gracilibacteria bacterium]
MLNIQQEFSSNLQQLQDEKNNRVVWYGNEQTRYGDLSIEQQNKYDQAEADNINWENEINRLKNLNLNVVDKVS